MKYDITFSKVILKGIQLELIESGLSNKYLAKKNVDKLQDFLNVHKQDLNCESVEVLYEDRYDLYAHFVPSAKKAFMSYATFEGLEGKLMGCLVMLDNGEEVSLGEFYVFQNAIDKAQQYIKNHSQYEWVETYKDLKLNV
jgi:hypothetical protein